jgi:ribosome-binding factor A
MPRKKRGAAAAAGGAASLSQRQLRVGEAIRQALAELIQRGRVIDRGTGEIAATVTEVRVSPDLRNATGYVVALGPGADDVLAPLNRLAPALQGELARMLHLKFAPRLHFERDPSFDAAAAVDALLRRPEVARDLGPRDDEDE